MLCGYFLHTCSRSLSHVCMPDSAYGPEESTDLTLTHITSCPLTACIISCMRCTSPTFDPTAASAVSLVPSANTQHPWYPLASMSLTVVSALTVPGRVSSIEVPPVTRMNTCLTPTRLYWAGIRCLGSGR